MASFVQEVLSATGHLNEKDDLGSKAARLNSRVNELKAGLSDKIAQRFEDFDATFTETSASLEQLESVFKEYELQKNSINHVIRPGLQEASKEAQDILDQLSQLSESVQNANLIKSAYMEMEKINEMIDQRKYLDAAALLNKLDNKICLETRTQDPATQKLSPASARSWEPPEIRFTSRWAKIGTNTSKSTSRMIKMSPWRLIFKTSGFTKAERVTQIVKAMEDANMLAYRLNKFGGKLLDLILIPVMMRQVDWVETDAEVIEIKLKSSSEIEDSVRHASEVISYMEQIFNFFIRKFRWWRFACASWHCFQQGFQCWVDQKDHFAGRAEHKGQTGAIF